MSHESNQEYFSRRSAEELARGNAASHPAAAAPHYDLAHRYGKFASQIANGTTELTLIEGGKEGFTPEIIHLALGMG